MGVKTKVKKDNSRKIEAALKKIVNSKLVVGVVNPKIAAYGTYNEFGTDKIPQRSFLRSTYDEQINKWRRLFAQVINGAINMEASAMRDLANLGDRAVADVKRKLSSNIPPPNAPSTVKKKGEGKTTLFDTGQLLKAIIYEVRRK